MRHGANSPPSASAIPTSPCRRPWTGCSRHPGPRTARELRNVPRRPLTLRQPRAPATPTPIAGCYNPPPFFSPGPDP
jgi:hypothetical protein